MTEMRPEFRKNERCPYCGSDDLITMKTGVSFYVGCRGCFATGPLVEEEEEAWEAWNRRANR